MLDTRIFIIRTTSDCNLDCSYCYVDKNNINKITVETAKLLIDQCDDLDEQNIVMIWHGGEPLLMGLKFYQFVVEHQKTKSKSFTNAIQTNGIALSDAFIRFFKDNNFEISLSLDLPASRQDTNRPLKNSAKSSFAVIEQSIARLKKAALPISLLSVVDAAVETSQAHLNFIDTNKVRSLAINLEFELARRHDPDLADRLSAILIDIYRYAANISRPFFFREAETIIETIRHIQNSYCWHSRIFCGLNHNAIDQYGNIYICCDKFIDEPAGYPAIGNIHSDKLKNIYTSANFQNLMHKLADRRAACVAYCEIGTHCRGACIHDVLLSNDVAKDRKKQVGCMIRNILYRAVSSNFLDKAERNYVL